MEAPEVPWNKPEAPTGRPLEASRAGAGLGLRPQWAGQLEAHIALCGPCVPAHDDFRPAHLQVGPLVPLSKNAAAGASLDTLRAAARHWRALVPGQIEKTNHL